MIRSEEYDCCWVGNLSPEYVAIGLTEAPACEKILTTSNLKMKIVGQSL